MKIALDYDQTYTVDPKFWNCFLDYAEEFGHEVRIVTARHPEKDKIDVPLEIIYCNGVAKRFYCEHFADWSPDVWIDDKPHSIDENSKATKEWLKEWRETRDVIVPSE